jgi:Co/Zn/Cd efflux system component
MIALLIGYEAVSLIFEPVPIHFREAIPIACLGLAVNIASAWCIPTGSWVQATKTASASPGQSSGFAGL